MIAAVKSTQKKYCSRAMAVAIFVALGFILAGYKPLGKGLVLGTLFSIINFILIGYALPLRLGKTGVSAFATTLGSILLRFGLMAVPLVAAVRLEQFNVFTVIAGLLMVQIMIISDQLFGAATGRLTERRL